MSRHKRLALMGMIFVAGVAGTGCGSTTTQSTATTTPSPTLASNSIHLVLTGDTKMDVTGTPLGTCGQSTKGGWTAAMTNSDGSALFVSVTGDVFRGPGTYPLTADPTATAASASVIDAVTSSGKQTVQTTSGSIRIEQDEAHAHIDAAAGFNQPPDFSTQSGNVHMVVDISC